jgi:Icc-related predicted phosphoesterase
MKIRILSDLHLEFQDFKPPEVPSDVVVLAGDIDIKSRGIAWAKKHFKQPVIYVPGNHEYYKGSLDRTLQKMYELSASSNVHVLNDDILIFGGVRFLGATLWTDYRLTGNQPLAEWDAQQRMSDFKEIRTEMYRKVRPKDLLEKHSRSRSFLTNELDASFDGPTVVISHHAPCEKSIHERYKTQSGHLGAAYASRLEHLMGPAVPLWIHGHTHSSIDYNMYGTRVVCNPRGYPPKHLNPDFLADLVVELTSSPTLAVTTACAG